MSCRLELVELYQGENLAREDMLDMESIVKATKLQERVLVRIHRLLTAEEVKLGREVQKYLHAVFANPSCCCISLRSSKKALIN
eukprot:g78572.t1